MTKKNIELLKRLRTRFLRMRHLEHFDMTEIATRGECGAVMCIAGHALDLAGYKRRWSPDFGEYRFLSPDGSKVYDPLNTAQRELGLDRDEAQGAHGLFFNWKLKTPKDAAEAIDKIIQGAAQ